MVRPDLFRGFTLIELSIVLVIIGLVTGGILFGMELKKSAEIRSAVIQLQRFEVAYRTFQSKYNCIMGDCPNATEFFGNGYMYSSSCTSYNGNGNNIIDFSVQWQCEPIYAKNQLLASNLLPTNPKTLCSNGWFFKGINDSCAYFYNDDLYAKVPTRKLDSMTWATGGINYVSGSAWANPALSPVQAKQIDEKIDDGQPSTGKFLGMDSTRIDGLGVAQWITNSCVTGGAYNQNEDYTCRALYYFK